MFPSSVCRIEGAVKPTSEGCHENENNKPCETLQHKTENIINMYATNVRLISLQYEGTLQTVRQDTNAGYHTALM